MADVRRAVIELAAPTSSPELHSVWETLRETVGLVTSFASVCLASSEVGIAKAGAAGGTAFLSGDTVVNFEDARVDQVRLVGFGSANGANTSLRVWDAAAGVALCTVALVNGAVASFVGAWTRVDTIGGGDRRIQLQAVGNGILLETVHLAELQMRTLRYIRK